MARYATRQLRLAQAALDSGRVREARRILRRAVRENPEDYLAWLLLARTAVSPQAAQAYLQRAEMLQPHDTAVRNARKRLTLTQPDVNIPVTPRRKARPRLPRWGVVLMVLLSFLLAGWWVTAASMQRARQGTLPAALAALAPTPLPTVTVAAAAAIPPGATPTLAPTPLPSPTPEPTAVAPQVFPGAPTVAQGERWIDVNLMTQTLTAYEGDVPVYTTAISSGTWQYPTVTGQFRTYMKYESQTMNGYLLGYDYYLPDVPYVMYFYNDYAIHGAYWHNNFGTPMSHGCVNMAPGDAGWLFNWAPVGTLVHIHG